MLSFWNCIVTATGEELQEKVKGLAERMQMMLSLPTDTSDSFKGTSRPFFWPGDLYDHCGPFRS